MSGIQDESRRLKGSILEAIDKVSGNAGGEAQGAAEKTAGAAVVGGSPPRMALARACPADEPASRSPRD